MLVTSQGEVSRGTCDVSGGGVGCACRRGVRKLWLTISLREIEAHCWEWRWFNRLEGPCRLTSVLGAGQLCAFRGGELSGDSRSTAVAAPGRGTGGPQGWNTVRGPRCTDAGLHV